MTTPENRPGNAPQRSGRDGRPTMGDVAREAGVSKTLASFALNDREGVSAETKKRILEVAARIGYQRDPFARALRTGHSGMYGVMVRNLRNPYFLDVLDGAQEAANEQGATILAVNSNFSVDRELELVRHLASQRISGLAITPVGTGQGVRLWQELCPGLPTVVINGLDHFGEGVRYVSPDNDAAIRLPVAHLAEYGHSRISLLTPPEALSMDLERITAFNEYCAAHGVVPELYFTPLNYDAVRSSAMALLARPDRPTAIITNSDYTAHAVIRAARDSGLRVGSELSVIGHDDLPTSELLDPPLTTVRFDRRAIGRATFEHLIGAIQGKHVEEVELIARGSTGPAPR